MKIVSYNINGFRAGVNKGFLNYFKQIDADIFCLQEIKMLPEQFEEKIENYHIYINSAIKKGYSGTMIMTKIKPFNCVFGIDGNYIDEGRIITLEYDNFFLVNCYVPNSQEELKRLDYRMEFEENLREYLVKLSKIKDIIYCGDLNVAHQEIDIKNPKQNINNAGFTIEERNKFTLLLESGFVDTFRYLYPTTQEFTWWSYRFNAKQKGIGWRLDYFIVNKNLIDKLVSNVIDKEISFSDHAPIILNIDI